MNLIHNPNLFDPAKMSKFNLTELVDLCDENEEEAAKKSLDATLHHWLDGQAISCRDWIAQILDEVKPLAIDLDVLSLLDPIQEVLDKGNQSMKWLQSFSEGFSIPTILNDSIKEMKSQEGESRNKTLDSDCS